MALDEHLTYEYLLEYYLRSQVYGTLKDFNKTYFPKHYEEMKNKLEEMIGEKNADTR
jgi:hypothetical protein